MKLKNARLCIECEEVFDPVGEVYRIHGIDIAICPSCGNSTSLVLSKILNSKDPPACADSEPIKTKLKDPAKEVK